MNEDRSALERELITIFEWARGVLPDDQVAEMEALTTSGEPGVALENFCVQSIEYDLVLPTDMLGAIEKLGRQMGLNERYWVRLPTK